MAIYFLIAAGILGIVVTNVYLVDPGFTEEELKNMKEEQNSE